MTDASTSEALSPKLLKVVERAKRDPEVRFLSLAHLIDEEALERAYHRLRKDAAVGVDGVTKEQYGQELDEQRQALASADEGEAVPAPADPAGAHPEGHGTRRDRSASRPSRTSWCRTRCERCWRPSTSRSFSTARTAFRPGRSAHDALRDLNRALDAGEVNWILEADIESFFDSIDRKKLMEMLRDGWPTSRC